MTTPAETAPEQLKMSVAVRIGWIVLICVTLYVCYLSHLGAIGFVGPDEPRYAWVARAMVETGDWVTPRLYGRPWFEKPPLFYWGAAICFKLFGVSEAAARLPSAISALLATLAMAWLAWRVYGVETARWVLLLLPTTVGMIGFSHAAATDMPFSGMLTVAMVCAAVVIGLTETTPGDGLAQHAAPLQRNGVARYRLLAIVLFGFFLGLAVLAKGPAGIILCGGAVFFWALFTERWRDGFRLLHPVGILAFCVTALPWYILCARRNPDFFRVFIIEHNFKRYLTPEFQHIQPFWFYVPVLIVALLPWTPAVVWTIVLGLRKAPTRHFSHLSWFLLNWCGVCVVFFSASQSKLPGYVLPTIPALGLLIASGITRATRRLAFSILGTGLSFLGAAIWVRYTEFRPVTRLGTFLQLTSFLLLVIALAEVLISASFLVERKPIRRVLLASGLFVMLLPLAFADKILERTYAFIISSRSLARGIQATPVCSKLMVQGIPRNFRYGLNFYLHDELIDWDYDPSRETCVLSTSARPENSCREIKEMSCRDLWGEQDRVDLFPTHLLHLVPLAGPSGGKAQ